jgi:hypothetical protein
MELDRRPFHLPAAIETALTLVRERAARQGLTLELDLDPRPPVPRSITPVKA